MATTELRLFSARPTLRVDGRENVRVTELLVEMEMQEREGGLSALEMRLSNVASVEGGDTELAFEDGRALHLGSALEVYAGEVTGPREIFRGVVTGLEAEFSDAEPPTLVVLAEDALQRARMSRCTAVYEDVSLEDLVGRIAGRLGLRPRVTGLSGGVGTLVQLNESDLAFLRRVLRERDGDVQVVGEELHVAPRSQVRRGTLTLAMHQDLTRVRILADLAHQVTEVTVSGWDPVQGSRVTGTSTGAEPGPGRGRTGAAVLADALGDRSEHLSGPPVTSGEQASILADSAFDARARSFVRAEGTAEGDPALRVGTHVELTGLGPRFSNTYYVTRTCHRFDRTRGYETDFEAECAHLGEG